MKKPAVSIVLGTYNRCKFLKLTIASIRKELAQFAQPCEIIIVDGGSTDGTIAWLTAQKDIISIIHHNRGTWQDIPITRRSWGYFMNLGFKAAQGKYICMLSDDCLVVPGAITNGHTFFEQQLAEGQSVGAIAFFYRNTPYHYKTWSQPGNYFVNKVSDKIYVNHGMYLKSALEDVNYIDEETYLFYAADVDLCFRLQKNGYRCVPAPNSYIEHYPHANRKIRKQNESPSYKDTQNFEKRWGTGSASSQARSAIKSTYHDKAHTIKQFSYIHFTNIGFWVLLAKEIKERRIKKIKSFFRQKS